jgi:predicted xylose isomerase-like sugar epimerase
MQDFWVNFAISTIIGVLQGAVKNEATKAKIKKAMLKIRDMINVMYPEESFTPARAAKAKKTLDEAA